MIKEIGDENEEYFGYGSRPFVGRRLPDLTLEAYYEDREQKIKFRDFLGRWLAIIFYPADFTFICPTELEDAALLHSEFQKAGAEIISVSCDTVYVHKAWHDHSASIKKIKFPMAADPTGRLSRALGVYLEEEGTSLRASFIIDPDGIIKSAEINDNSIGRSASELLRKLQAAVEVRNSGGAYVCPANWRPGGKTLKPGMDLVGKI